MLQQIRFPALAITALTLLLGCNGGFRSSDLTPILSPGNVFQGNPNDGVTPPNWDKVQADGFVSGGAYSGQLVVDIDRDQQSLRLTLPIPLLVPLIAPIELAEAPGAYLYSFTNPDGSMALALNMPLRYIIRDAAFTSGQRLPSGDPLPFIPAGELPGFGIDFPQMPKYRIHIYIGVNVAAAFVELPDLGLPIGGIFPIKNKAKTKVVGAFGYILPKQKSPGGMYLATQIPDDLARLIDELIRW
jgi:hypothetical protein